MNRVLLLEPKSAALADKTHAAMVVSTETVSDVSFSADYKTLAQLRQGTNPNSWETAWAIFNYRHDAEFYYVALKTNGWELGKADAAYPGYQRFLATGDAPSSGVSIARRFEINVSGAQITLRIDGDLLVTFTDEERPYLDGKVGFYTEDARVVFDNVAGSITEDFERYALSPFTDGDRLGAKWDVRYVGYGRVAIVEMAPLVLRGTDRLR